ncbi:MAG: hypothetical protein EOP69_01225 [Spirochaetia bacterium]|nr:MAG: hypothetical protein EOP69_01225 [Spirochaetia bacterium]
MERSFEIVAQWIEQQDPNRKRPFSEPASADEIEATDGLVREIYRLSGKPVPHEIPLRLPYGLAAGDVRDVVLQRLGRAHVGWTAMADDWCRPPPTPHHLAAAMRDHTRPRWPPCSCC